MNHAEIDGLMKALAPIVADFTVKAMAPLRAENERLSGCILEMEKRFESFPSREENSVLILRLVEETVTKLPPAPAGKDGTDADLALIGELVDKAVAALEPAKDGVRGPAGESVTPEQLAPMVAELVTQAVASEIEKVVPTIPAGPQGEPGKSVEIEDIVPLIAAEVERAVSEIPKPENGKDADPVEIAALLIPEVERAVAQLPKAENGKDGTSVSIDDVAPLIAEEVSKAVAAIPVPENGKDGAAGKDGEPGKSVDESVVLAMIDQNLRIQIPFAVEDEVAKIRPQDGRDGRDGLPGLQGEKGLDGRDGIDGKDGFGIDDFEFKSENEGRTLVLSLKQVDRDPIVQEVQTSIVLDRGVWREQEYAKGDGVTWGGSFFIAQRATTGKEKPGEVPEAFRLSIKRGRDGKDGKDGKQGDRGPEGKAGRDMTQKAF